MNHAGRFEHPGQLECGLARLEPVEQALTRTEYHRADLKIDLVDESCHDRLPGAGGPSGDRDGAPTRSGFSLVLVPLLCGFRNRTDLAASLPFTVRTLADIEQGVRKASPGTYAMLENKLAWAPGSINTILAGGEPQETVAEPRRPSSAPSSHPAPDALSRASTEQLLLELRCRITAPRSRRHEGWDDWDDGLDPRGDWPEQG
jgi:hypothetical protein